MGERLYIAAKAPRAMVAKTRLGAVIGHDNAVALYRAFLKDLAARFADAPFALAWYITPQDAWTDIAPLVDPEDHGSSVLVQPEGDWTKRQRRLFLEAAGRGEERVVLVASDSPHLTVDTVEKAFRELDRHDLVFGPTHDGGYYLIGMRGYHEVLCGIPMSTGTELGDIAARSREAGLSVGQVEATFDVDEVQDIEHLRRLLPIRSDLAATRTALAALGLYEEGGHPTNTQSREARIASEPVYSTAPTHPEEST